MLTLLEIDNSLNKLGFAKIADQNLIHNKYYFEIDEKYIVYYSIFSNVEDLVNNWETFQNQDIGIYLQQKKYYRKAVRWDIYYLLIYTGEIPIQIGKIIEIEKDKFCSKKCIVCAKDIIELHNQLNKKLPVTLNYYSLSDYPIISDDWFLKKLSEEINILPELIQKDYLTDTLKNRQKIETLLMQGV